MGGLWASDVCHDVGRIVLSLFMTVLLATERRAYSNEH